MTIRMSEVKTLCTPSEQALVAASRKPQLQDLNAADLRRNVARSRKLLEKWQHLGRSQSRARSQTVGFGEEMARSRRKAEIFADALASFQTQLEKVEPTDQTATSSKRKPKKIRARETRAARATGRKQLSKQQEALNREEDKRIKAALAKRSATPKSQSDTSAAAASDVQETAAGQGAGSPAKGRKARAALRPPVTPLAKRRPEQLGLQEPLSFKPSKPKKAATAAKQARVIRSGLTTRVRGHVSARGRRVQGRRDQRNG